VGLNYNGVYNGGPPANSRANFGAGIYKIIFLVYIPTATDPDIPQEVIFEDYVYVETDANGASDIHFTLYDNWLNGGMRITFYVDNLLTVGTEHPIEEVERYIRMWDPYHDLNEPGYPYVEKNYGNQSYGYGNLHPDFPVPNGFTEIPQVCISDCIYDNKSYNQNSTGEFFSREGRIPLNTTFKKNITTRNIYPFYSTVISDIIITAEPGVKLVIGSGANYSTDAGISFTLKPFQSEGVGNFLYIKDPFDDPEHANPTTTLELEGNDIGINRNSKLIIQDRCKTRIYNGAKLLFGKYSQALINPTGNIPGGIMDWENGSNVEMGINSQIIVYASGELYNKGTTFLNLLGSEIKIEPNGTFKLSDNKSQTISTGGKINLNGGNLELGNNAHLILDGIDANIIATSGSHIKLGDNALIEIKNGGNFIANGCIIESNPGVTGRGINIENAGSSTTITNCTFTNLKYSLRISNDNSTTANTYRYIYNNTFTTNSLCEFVLELRNAKNTTIQDNHIIMSGNSGLGLLLRYPTYLQNDDDSPTTSTVNIIHNDIYYGQVSCAILSLTSSVVPILFKDNILYGSGVTFNLIERQISGSIKNNQFTNGMENCNLELSQSTPDILNNIFLSNYSNINNYYSYPSLAPETQPTTDAGWIWVGGKNKLTSTSFGNYYFVDGYATLDWGENCFFKPASTNMKYLWGGVTMPQPDGYLMRNNDFNGTNFPDPTNFDLFTYPNGPSIEPSFNGSNFECPNIITTDLGTIWQISDRGNGIYDTVYSTANNSGIPVTPDQYLYSQAFSSNSSAQYYEAIVYLKTLISNYPSSEYIMQGLTDLYMNYISLDTSSNQGTRNILFSDLKNFLDDKILSGLYSDEFNFSAYNYTLMCLSNMTEYIEAKDGYEFIALYHPEAFIRLMASWDYDEILTLLNGSGAISSKEENMTESEFYNHLKKRIDASIGEDPIKQKVLKSYKKAQKEKQNALEKGVKSIIKDEKSANSEISRIKSEESKIDQKTLSVLRYAKTLSKEEKDKKQLEDFLFGKVSLTGSKPLIDNIMPKTYELSQNYPNPFNPSTKIKYSIPKDGLVTLKIFDITGREIRTLVSEQKTAGNYLVEFNASGLSSGVYFYQIKTGDFIQTKRMVLIK